MYQLKVGFSFILSASSCRNKHSFIIYLIVFIKSTLDKNSTNMIITYDIFRINQDFYHPNSDNCVFSINCSLKYNKIVFDNHSHLHSWSNDTKILIPAIYHNIRLRLNRFRDLDKLWQNLDEVIRIYMKEIVEIVHSKFRLKNGLYVYTRNNKS